jgi:hypothetical protein
LKLERPLHPQELTVLDKQLAQLGRQFKSQRRTLLIGTLLILAIGAVVHFKVSPELNVVLLWAAMAVFIGIGTWVFGKEYLQQQSTRKSIAYLKSKNLVTVIVVKSDKYYELREQEDEGVYYLFQLDGNKVFSFGGQDFYPSRKFPSDNFEIVEGRGINNETLLLEVFSYGKKIKPNQIITGQAKWNLLNSPNYPNPNYFTITDGSIEDYAQAVVTPDA